MNRVSSDSTSREVSAVDPGVQIIRDGAVAVVEFFNPPLNLLTMQLRASLHEVASQIGADSAVRAVVLCSAGDRAFSAGSDIREFPADAAAGVRRAEQEHACYDAISAMPQPVVTAIQGTTLGGGLELAMSSDIRIAESSARLGLPEVRLGVFPSGGGTQRLARLVTPSRAKRMMFLGEIFDADQSLELGLVDEVVPPRGARDAALRLAHSIAHQPGLAVRAIKTAVDHGLSHGAEAGQAMEVLLISELFASHDAQEGVQAFLEKRPPRFQHI